MGASSPGDRHTLPEGAMCDQHPDRPAVANVQGETDSFGYETILMCQECLNADRAYEQSAEAGMGRCDWCKKDATDLRWARDYDEGMHGPTYQVCGACQKRRDDRVQQELDEYNDRYDFVDDYDPADDCGAYTNGRFSYRDCRLAGTEFCDFECPNARRSRPSTSPRP